MARKKPGLSFWQIWNMSFGFFGIQFGFALQNANVSRIFETLGASIDNIPVLWIAAPVTGLIIQPIIGHMSDNTWNRLGRRRPYFLSGALLASAALIFMPHSPVLWIAAGALWIMDASINISMEPFRAFVGDMLPSEQRTTGFAMQSFFIGTGAVIASALPYILTNWFNVPTIPQPGHQIPPNVRWSFLIGGIVFFSAVVWTVVSTKEYSPEELAEFNQTQEETEEKESAVVTEKTIRPPRFYRNGIIWIFSGLFFTWLIRFLRMETEVYIMSFGLLVFGILQLIAGLFTFRFKKENGLVTVLTDLARMPETMKQLAVVQFFSWFALFAMWIYTTAGITSHIYDMTADIHLVNSLQVTLPEFSRNVEDSRVKDIRKELDEYQKRLETGKYVAVSMKVVNFFLRGKTHIDKKTADRLVHIENEYNKGANWVGVLFGFYNGFAAVLAFLLPVLAKYFGRKRTHAISLIAGGVGLASVYLFMNPRMLIIPMFGIGLAWASILSMPYAILTGSLPAQKMGTYMGIFNFFIVIPQILAASILGFTVKTLFHNYAIYALVLGGFSMILAAILVIRVNDVDDPRNKKQTS